ncbi:Glycosylphosphatidylinositol specific phospholipase D1 [Podila verticillata]|nr:Glycosylphosphatidylinositol specific phospholipase D1 [Podila verticillata]
MTLRREYEGFDAHWPPFIEASLRYLHAKYPKPWDDHVQSLIVFLFGTVSHSLGDVSWHALEGLEQGFINVLAETSFDGDYTKGHTLADIGAEFVLSHMSTMNHLMTSWKVPVKDITEIYKTMGYYVPGAVLSHCMRNGFTGAQANARLGSQLFPVYASRVMSRPEQVEDYPMGGLRDMAEWSVECWNGLAEYLDDDRNLPPKSDASIESNSTSFNLCYALWEDRPKNNHTTKRNRHDHMHAVKVDVEEAQVRLRDAGLGVQTSTDGITGMVTFSVVRSDAATAEPEDLGIARNIDTQQINLRLQSQTSSSAVQFSRPSKILRMYNKDNKARAAALGPLQRPNMCSPVDNGDENNGTITLYLPFEYASFGHSVVSGDFDGDGVTDIAVGAPHVTLDPMIPSQGSVFVVQGQSLFSGDPSGTYEGSTPKSRFGWSMAVVDLNQDGIDDLAIGAPGHGAIDLTYTGSVFVYFGHSGTGLSMTPDVTIYLNKTTATAGTKDEKDTLAGLGYKLRGMDLTGSGYQDLVISMPMASVVAEDGTVRRQAGRVLAFLAQSHHLGYTLDTDRDWELQGDKAFDWFGSAITLATQSSRPGSPMSLSEGKPFFRDDPDKIRQCFTGADTRTRFGSQLLLADLNSDGMDEIVVTSAHDSRFAIMAGTITIKDTRR